VKKSHGEVKKPDTIDWDKLNNEGQCEPIEAGLFCEKIFGRLDSYTCDCGIMGFSHERYKKQISQSSEEALLRQITGKIIQHRINAHAGNICNECGKPITPIYERLKRWGHIKLVVPVTHIWFLKNTPSSLSSILGIQLRNLVKVVYYESYVVTKSSTSSLPVCKIFSQPQYENYFKKYGNFFEAKWEQMHLKIL
jgi:DNA-directed RNA polymerase subunit beta'